MNTITEKMYKFVFLIHNENKALSSDMLYSLLIFLILSIGNIRQMFLFYYFAQLYDQVM